VSEPYELYVLGTDARADRAVRVVDTAIAAAGGGLEEDAMLLLNDIGDDDEHDFEPAGKPEEALARVASWPTLGMLLYEMPEGAVSVAFKGSPDRVDAVALATPETLSDLPDESIERWQALGRRLHAELGAARTIMGWGLKAGGHGWKRELDSARSGDWGDTFELLDLRGT
jgi:hypothetical protein